MPAWKPAWFDTGVHPRAKTLWRGVEAQHVVATMRLADSAEEQRVLEELLESSKPPVPPEAAGRHWLVFTPFRYRAPIASRFRREHDAGVWYGAEELATACAEAAFWKWRFLMDSDALDSHALHTEHTFFAAKVKGRCVDLTAAPWNAAAKSWRHKTDYSACQGLAAQAHGRDVAWIRYASARTADGLCAAVFQPQALSLSIPLTEQTWACKTTRDGAYLHHSGSGEKLGFSVKDWL